MAFTMGLVRGREAFSHRQWVEAFAEFSRTDQESQLDADDLERLATDVDEIRDLLQEAGFRNVEVGSAPARLDVPAPDDFLWQYVSSTPMLGTFMKASQKSRDALERDITAQWQRFRTNDGMNFEVRMATAIGWT